MVRIDSFPCLFLIAPLISKEIQAASVLLGVNITIHQLDSPRWDVVNFAGARSIHLSYHDVLFLKLSPFLRQGQHYSSVRPLRELMSHNAPSAVSIVRFPILQPHHHHFSHYV